MKQKKKQTKKKKKNNVITSHKYEYINTLISNNTEREKYDFSFWVI